MADGIKPHLTSFLLYIGGIFLLIVVLGFLFSTNNKTKEEVRESTTSAATTGKNYPKPPEMKINPNKKYTATLNTNKGIVKIELFTKETPITVNNFVFLARDGFYNGTIFHRVIKGFMIQGGDPKGDGTGGPGYKFNDEKITRNYTRGIVAMANSGPNTNGSQFFIMHKDTDLPKNYVIFGKVIEGLETVDKITQVPVTGNGMGENSKPAEKIILEKVTIAEN